MRHDGYYPNYPGIRQTGDERRRLKRRICSVWGSMGIILLCLILLTGSTFAWFNDTAQGTGRIQAGNLKIGFWAASALNGGDLEHPVDLSDPTVKIFNEDEFMPGSSGYRYIKIENNGTMPLSYQVEFSSRDENKLGEVITFTLEKAVENSQPIPPKAVAEVGGDSIAEETGVKSPSLPVESYDIYKITYTMASTLENQYNATGSGSPYEYLLDITVRAKQTNQ